MYAKYYLVIPFRTLGVTVLPVRSSNASRFCRFYIDIVEVLRTSALPLSSNACWLSRVRIVWRLVLCVVVMPWEGKPNTLLYWKIPCIGAHVFRRSCSSTTLVLPPSLLLTRWVSVPWVNISYVYRTHTLCRGRNLCHVVYVSCAVPYIACVVTYMYVMLSILVSAWDPLLRGEHICRWRLMDYEVSDSIKEDLVLTPQAGAFVRMGPSGAPPLGSLLSSF